MFGGKIRRVETIGFRIDFEPQCVEYLSPVRQTVRQTSKEGDKIKIRFYA